eukprot:SAG22_NODE_178_length_16142_cov_13.187995_3_plen_345_part_00
MEPEPFTMDPGLARETREQLLRDGEYGRGVECGRGSTRHRGLLLRVFYSWLTCPRHAGYCMVDGVVPPDFLQELRDEADRINDSEPHDPTAHYQGTHIGVSFDKNPVMRRLADYPRARQAAEALGLGDFAHGGGMIVLTKEPAGKRASEPLYWHHDGSLWNDPLCCTPWPQTIFFNYYLEDAAVAGGCLRVIPGTHLQRIDLHDVLVTAHEGRGGDDGGARSIPDDGNLEEMPMFADHPAQVNVLSKAGSLGAATLSLSFCFALPFPCVSLGKRFSALACGSTALTAGRCLRSVLGDMRLLHAAHRNTKPTRRNLLLIWHSRPVSVPQFWIDEVGGWVGGWLAG